MSEFGESIKFDVIYPLSRLRYTRWTDKCTLGVAVFQALAVVLMKINITLGRDV